MPATKVVGEKSRREVVREAVREAVRESGREPGRPNSGHHQTSLRLTKWTLAQLDYIAARLSRGRAPGQKPWTRTEVLCKAIDLFHRECSVQRAELNPWWKSGDE